MDIEKKVVFINGTAYLPITADLAKWLEIKDGEENLIIIRAELNKEQKKFVSFWKKGF